jgi:formate hydrogenlyase transcriptional activator
MTDNSSGLVPEHLGEGEWCDHQPESAGPERCRYRLLLEVANLIVTPQTQLDLFKELAPRVLKLTDCDFLNFSVHDPQQNCMLTHYWKKDRESGEFNAFAVGDCISGSVWVQQKLVTLPDVEKERRFPECMQVLRQHGVRSYSMFPLSTEAHRFGALGLGRAMAKVLDSRDEEFFTFVASLVALALERQAARHAAEQQQQRLQGLVMIGEELSSGLDMEALIANILANLRRILRHDHAALMMLEEDGQTLRKYAMDSIHAPKLLGEEMARIPLRESLSARVIQTRNAAVWSAEELSSSATRTGQTLSASGIQSLCALPLLAGGQVCGALLLGNARKDAFSQQDTEYLQQVANRIGGAFGDARAYREVVHVKDQLTREKRYLEREIGSEMRWGEIVGHSLGLKRVLDYGSIVAATDSTVLITGETGTGKEQIARAIHGMSPRRDRSFIKLNCAAIPTGLLESELFGHEKGAFTSAVSQKIGRIELADKGTLFLDEIGEISLELQPKLLRVLQDQEFERLGGTRTIRVDVRLIAATNRNLTVAVEEKQFRSDLFYRLNVFPLHLPALRERREDIPLLVRYFVEKFAKRMKRQIEYIPDEAIEAMLQWSWPGNIRELENFIERSVILSDGNKLRAPLAELRQEIARQKAGSSNTLRDREREQIIQTLRQTRGVLSGPGGAASRLGLKRTTLQYRMQKLGISRLEYLD